MNERALGWLGTGRMGAAMAGRLLAAGQPLRVWNRTPEKAAGLVSFGAELVGTAAELASCDVVFVMVGTPEHVHDVLFGASGLLSASQRPAVIVDCSTIDAMSSARTRESVNARGIEFLACPISGNPHVVREGEATFVSSGPRPTFDRVEKYLVSIAKKAVYVGPEEQARTVKLAHNLYLGLMVQSLAEVTSLAMKSGVPMEAFLDFLNSTVLAMEWVRRRTPDMVNMDWTPTFTTEMLRKDFDLGLLQARSAEVPMPLAACTHQFIQEAICHGFRYQDFLSLFEIQASRAGLQQTPLAHNS